MNKVSWCRARVDQVTAALAGALNAISKLVQWPAEAAIDRPGKQDGDIDIAVPRRGPSREASEKVRGEQTRLGSQRFARTFNGVEGRLTFHGP